MIKRLAVENFKSIGRLELECGRVNVFIGEPNSGKSNLLEALGSLSLLAYEGETEAFLRTRDVRHLFHNYNIRENMRISFDEHELIGRFSPGVRCIDMLYKGDVIGRIGPNQAQVVRESVVHEALRLGAFRFYRFNPRAAFTESKESHLLPPDGRNLPSVLLYNPELRSLVADILEDYGQKPLVDEVEGTFSVLYEVNGLSLRIPYALVSDTIRRYIFFLAAVKSNENAVVVLEEPEAHAFPPYVKHLAECIGLDKRNQYFISTHNPYLLISLIEKTPVRELAVYVTYLREHETSAKLLVEEELSELLDLTASVFFNLDRFIEELPGASDRFWSSAALRKS